MKRWNRFLAFFRLSKKAVCEESNSLERPEADYHDYHDATDGDDGWPCHGYEYTCRRCGKKFTI
jgi:hypothetical protein